MWGGEKQAEMPKKREEVVGSRGRRGKGKGEGRGGGKSAK